ncbi:MAG: asparaginase [Clostridiales bacterium]|nr:asparaginase [Candidatus Cacconaster stercorequi]
MKKILIIGTGGTIASSPTDNGLAPSLTSAELLNAIPSIRNICLVDCVQPFSLDSTNVRPEHWLIVEETIRENYDRYDGFVISHGTDTMAYTAAALSYLIQNSAKPIVLTGAQKPIGEEGTDAKRNLTDALIYACDEQSHGVVIVFSGAVICGTRARKNFSKRAAAFGSINFPELARVQDNRIIRYVPEAVTGSAVFYDYLNPNVGLLKLTPGMNNNVMRYAIDTYDGLVIESFGVGGLPEYSDFYMQIKRAVQYGKCIVMTTQVPNEGSDLSVYRVGSVLKNSLNVLEAHDMTSEAVLCKLMWLLGQTRDFDKAKELFYRPVNHDILCL